MKITKIRYQVQDIREDVYVTREYRGTLYPGDKMLFHAPGRHATEIQRNIYNTVRKPLNSFLWAVPMNFSISCTAAAAVFRNGQYPYGKRLRNLYAKERISALNHCRLTKLQCFIPRKKQITRQTAFTLKITTAFPLYAHGWMPFRIFSFEVL